MFGCGWDSRFATAKGDSGGAGFIWVKIGAIGPAGIKQNCGFNQTFVTGLGIGGECASPSDVAMTVGIERVTGFAEDPSCALKAFSESEIIGSDVVFGCREALLSSRELVHERESEIVLLAGEIDRKERAAEMVASFPADLATEAGSVKFMSKLIDRRLRGIVRTDTGLGLTLARGGSPTVSNESARKDRRSPKASPGQGCVPHSVMVSLPIIRRGAGAAGIALMLNYA